MKKRLLAFLFHFSLVSLSFAQQEAQFSQYMFNNIYYNPAYSGLEEQPMLTLFHRTQWAGYQASFDDEGSPNTQLFSFNTPLKVLGGGIAAHVVNDKLGPLSNLEAHLSYAYHIEFRKNARLSIGLRGGIYSQSLNYGLYRPVDANDPLLQMATGKDTQIGSDMSAGMYYMDERLEIGLSSTRLLESDFDFDKLSNPLSRNIYLTSAYNFSINDRWDIKPSILLKSDFNTYSFDISTLIIYQQKIWGGLAYRQNDVATLMLGMNILEDKYKNVRLKAGYSFDYTVYGKQAKSPTSHELFVAYCLPIPKGKTRNRQETPRFHF